MPRMHVRGSIFRLQPEAPKIAEDVAAWRLVERRLLSPARPENIECLVRLERVDGVRGQWRAGDLVALCDAPNDLRNSIDPFAAALPGPRHGAVGLVPGGWPADDWIRRSPSETRLPIASAAGSGILDLIVFAAVAEVGTLGGEVRHRLLLDTTMHLRHVRSPGNWFHRAPLIFVGDLASTGFARAALQENDGEDALVLIESGPDGSALPSEAIFQRACWRDGIIRAMPGKNGEGAPGMFAAHRRKIGSLLQCDARIVIAGGSERFLSAVFNAFDGALGCGEASSLEARGQLAKLRL